MQKNLRTLRSFFEIYIEIYIDIYRYIYQKKNGTFFWKERKKTEKIKRFFKKNVKKWKEQNILLNKNVKEWKEQYVLLKRMEKNAKNGTFFWKERCQPCRIFLNWGLDIPFFSVRYVTFFYIFKQRTLRSCPFFEKNGCPTLLLF